MYKLQPAPERRYVFSAPTKIAAGARDLSRRNVRTAQTRPQNSKAFFAHQHPCGLKSALRRSRGDRAKHILAESAKHFLPCCTAARTGAMPALLYGLLPGIGHADHAARDAGAGITHRLTAVIDLGMHDHAPADDRILQAGNRYVLHGDFVVRLAVVVRLEISQIAR